MRMLALMVAVAGLLRSGEGPSKSELDKYQGTWVLVAEEFEGEAIPAGKMADRSYTIRGDKLLYNSNGKARSATVKLDPSKTPKTYDLVRDDGLRSLRGIYAWDGDTIKVCSADDQGPRPEAFKTEPGSKNRIQIWKRKK
jgi:uncharacterized protein (TIGR03067 family)